jgi:hypothetical protein
MAQWLIDPEHAPSARDLTQALQRILADVSTGHEIPTMVAASED